MSARDVLVTHLDETAGLYAPEAHADAILAALHAAGFVVEQGWQPASTAPRDGTPIVLIGLYPNNVTWSDQYQSWWHKTARFSAVVEKEGHWARWPHTIPPTHWRPLPQPPKETGDEG